MKPSDPHKLSRAIRQFKPSRKPAGVFTIAVAFCDASLLALAFFLAVSPFVLQPGININLPSSPFTGGERFDTMVLSISRGGRFYFNDERLGAEQLGSALKEAVAHAPGVPLIIEADRSVPHGKVVEAWNLAMEAGIEQISIATSIAAAEEELP